LKNTIAAACFLLLGFMTFQPAADSQDTPKSNVTAEQVNDQYILLRRPDIRSKRKQLVAVNLLILRQPSSGPCTTCNQGSKIYDVVML